MQKIRYNVALHLCRVRIQVFDTLGLEMSTACEALVNFRIQGVWGEEGEAERKKGEAFRHFD